MCWLAEACEWWPSPEPEPPHCPSQPAAPLYSHSPSAPEAHDDRPPGSETPSLPKSKGRAAHSKCLVTKLQCLIQTAPYVMSGPGPFPFC